MKTFVQILVLLCVFIHTAEGLQCSRCYGYSSCDQTPQNCSGSQTFCFSRATTDSYNYGMSRYHHVEKGCASHDICSSTGSHVMSHDIGYQAHVTNITCCDTDNCNDAVADYPTSTPPPAGPLQCYGCDPSRHECIANVTCRDHEACFQSSPSSYSGHQPYYGCISENACSNSSLSTLYGVDHVSCCNTSHCNVPEMGIQCQTCADYSCSSQRSVICSNYTTMCHSQFHSETYYYYGTYTHLEKGCASSEKCPSTGSHLISHNIGSVSRLTYTSCCDTDNCNNNDTDVSVPPPGSLQCYGCDMYEDHCTANLTCHEHETCFKSTTHYNNELHFGCISENVCGNSSLSTPYGFDTVSCCNTSHCNVPELPGHKCLACSDYQCSSERSVFCTEDAPFCYSRIESYRSGYTSIHKGCARSNICPATVENQVVSVHAGYYSFIRNITCCDTDNCNVANQTTSMIPAGSLQCYTCDSYSRECDADTVTCNELEVCSMTPANSSARIHGCVSENLCNNATMTQQYFGYYEEISCCDTDFCNDPNKTGSEDKDDGSVFNSAGPMLSLSVPLCLLGLFTRTF